VPQAVKIATTHPGPVGPVPEGGGIPVGFDEVYQAHFSFVWRNVLNRGVPRSAVDDVVQEVFLVVHRKLSAFEGRAQVRTWLATVIRKVVAGHLRRRRNQPMGEPLEGDTESTQQGPAEALETKAAVSSFYEIMEQMTDEQREVFVLHDLEQMKGREIAEITDTNENTVHTRLRAARRIFQEGVARLNAEGTP
jgi:RNA polymerase sigma-70 factor, ECF subfamily